MLLPRWPFIVVLFLLGANGFLHPKLEGTAAGLRNAPANYYDEAVVGTEKHENAGTVEDTPADSSFRSFARSKFPFFTAPRAPDEYGGERWVFLENAGGSQVPNVVLGGSAKALETRWRSELGPRHVTAARQVAAAMLNAEDPANVVLGGSTSGLFRSLAAAYAQTLRPGDEVVVCEWSHEAHIAPWVWAAHVSGASVLWWRLDPCLPCGEPPCIAALGALVGPRTRLVALTHVSNILGTVCDVKGATALVRERAPLAHVAIDGVAFVPHSAPDVQAVGCDWYAFSCYKAFGPHMAVLYGRRATLEAMREHAPNHPFVEPHNDGAVRWELGTVNQEAAAGLAALGRYLSDLATWPAPDKAYGPTDKAAPLTREAVEAAYARIASCEAAPAAHLLAFLASCPRVRILGRPSMRGRVPTVSLVHSELSAKGVCDLARKANIVCRHGSFLAPRLLDALGVPDPHGDGVLRFSLAHYNTISDVERTIEMLIEAGF